MSETEVWTIDGLLRHFLRIHSKMEERAFCFLLGAGASRGSGIPLAGEMVNEWLADLYIRRHGEDDGQANNSVGAVEAWATADNLDIPQFHYSNRAEFYPEVYQRRFEHDREAGYSFLEQTLENENVSPGLGYAILAQILTGTRHRVVVTTNFDDLVADAISVFTDTSCAPLVCGHEALTQYIRLKKRRPLIAKVHRDLLLEPKSEPGEIRKLEPAWEKVLRELFQSYTPIVIGYGGNDGSLMSFFGDTLEPESLTGQLVWCYLSEHADDLERARRDLPRKAIRDVVARHHGVFVPIAGFDKLMVDLCRVFEQVDQNERAGGFRFDEIGTHLTQATEQRVRKIQVLYEKDKEMDKLEPRFRIDISEFNWFKWVKRAQLEKDTKGHIDELNRGRVEFPFSLPLLHNLLVTLEDHKNEIDKNEIDKGDSDDELVVTNDQIKTALKEWERMSPDTYYGRFTDHLTRARSDAQRANEKALQAFLAHEENSSTNATNELVWNAAANGLRGELRRGIETSVDDAEKIWQHVALCWKIKQEACYSALTTVATCQLMLAALYLSGDEEACSRTRSASIARLKWIVERSPSHLRNIVEIVREMLSSSPSESVIDDGNGNELVRLLASVDDTELLRDRLEEVADWRVQALAPDEVPKPAARRSRTATKPTPASETADRSRDKE